MGNVGFSDAVSDFGAHDFADALDVLLIEALDVALGDVKAAFIEGHDDFVVGQIVGEHAVDHVAFEFREVGDLAVARFATRPVL